MTTHPWSRRAVLALAGATGAGLYPDLAATLDWPTHPVRMILPFVPGGGADLVARFVSDPLAAELRQPVVVENRGGAGGTIGSAAVAQAPADGYTLLYGTPGPPVTNPILMPALPYDAERDFAPVSLLTRSAYVMAVHAGLPVRSVAEAVPGFDVTVFNYLCVRTGTPRPIIDRLNQALVKVLADPGLHERMAAAGASPPVSSTPEELGAILRSESAKWRAVIQRAGIKAG